MNRPSASGLDGVVVAETELSDVDGEAGRLVIRGYEVEELVERATFEDVCGLLWNGTWPSTAERETLRAALNARNIVKPGIDWISWGPGDMAFDIERHSNSPFKTIEDVHKYVIDQLKGYDVRLPDS